MSRRRRNRNANVHGVLIVDKPSGPTSHDAVGTVRRALGTRAVGHAGTLDPAARGVLVIAVGEATKLVNVLSEGTKGYEAIVELGTETDTLDAEGAVTRTAPLPSDLGRAEVEEVAKRFVGRFAQRAPAFSALKQGGGRLYERARRGEQVEAPLREVVVYELAVRDVEGGRIRLRMTTGKGFYVRSLARDLGEALGTVAHLASLERTRSGAFERTEAVPLARLEAAAQGDETARSEVHRILLSLEDACRDLAQVSLTERGRDDARHGRAIRAADVDALPDVDPEATLALLGPDGHIVALGRRDGDTLRVTRGLAQN